jgi:hypothetical protein
MSVPRAFGTAADDHDDPKSSLERRNGVGSYISELAPTATQNLAELQATPYKGPSSNGSSVAVQVAPKSSVVSLPFWPTATHFVAEMHWTLFSTIASFCCAHVLPPSCVTKKVLPEAAIHSNEVGQLIDDRYPAPTAGRLKLSQVFPPSVVLRASASIPASPTAKQVVNVGHERDLMSPGS